MGVSVRSRQPSRLVSRPAAAALDEFEIRLRCGVDDHELAVAIDREAIDVAERTAQLFEIVDNRARGGDGGGHIGAAKAVERLHFEMFAESEVSLVGEKGVAVARLDARDVA
jgi:hypothetical protein